MEGDSLSDQHRELLSLLKHSGARLFSLLVRLTLREDVAEDLMQDLFIRLSDSRGFREANPLPLSKENKNISTALKV